MPSSTTDFRRIFECSPGLYLVLTAKFDICAVSNAYLAATLTQRENIVDKHIFDVFPDNPNDSDATGETNLRASLKTVLRTKASDTLAVQKYDILLPDGSGRFETRYWSCFNTPILNEMGEVDFIIHRAEDVTEFLLLQQKGLTSEKEMEVELFQRAQELQVTNQKLRAAEQLKSEFLATMSHEIRTPMNGIMGMTDLILMTELNNTQRGYAKIIHDSCGSLLTIINDILDFSKIEAGKLDLEIINFSPVQAVENQSDLFISKIKSKGLSFATFIDPEIPHFLKGDPGRIGQILLNLIGNAVKFTASGSVFVEVKLVKGAVPASEGGPYRIQFSVIDTGPGIAPGTLLQLFEPFMQADRSMSRKFGGTGLGLSISKRLVQLMNGEIGVESTEGEGSRFHFTLPLMKGEPIVGENLIPRADLHNFKILVTDTDAMTRNVLADYIKSRGATTDRASSTECCLKMLNNEAEKGRPHDLVFIDLKEESIPLAKKILATPGLKKTKLILASSLGENLSEAELRQAGFSASITKPFKQSQIFDCIVSTMSNTPAFLNSSETEPARPRLADEGHLTRVLLVEDNVVNQMVARTFLEKMGLSVLIASNGQEALQHLEVANFNLIIMDCQMPVLNGFEAAQMIRKLADPEKSSTPIIALTANAMNGDEERCLRAGMNDYLAKPIQKKIFDRKVRQWLRQSLSSNVAAAPDPKK